MTANDRHDERALQLTDGRTLQVSEWGPRDGRVVLHFHGSSSSRLERPPDLGDLDHTNVRLVTVDRPGHGGSTYQPERQLLDWPKDVAQLADQMGLDRFHVSGWSVGGSHALATAFALPDRVLATAVIAPMPPPGHPAAQEGTSRANRAALSAARRMPGLVLLGSTLGAGALRRNPGRAIARLRKTAPPVDRRLLDDPTFAESFAQSISEAYRNGKGPGLESTMIVRPWGFRLSDISGPVSVWHGSADPVVPVAAGRFVSAQIPNAELHEIAGAGHLLVFHEWRQILQWLAGQEDAP